MVTQAKIDQSASFQRGDPVGPSTVTYDISVQKRDDQFDQEWFVFDRSNSQAVRRWGELLAETDVDTASLEGSDAPSLELRTIEGKLIKLSEIKQDVVVLCFWASWGGPQCYRAFPVWQQIADSAAKQGESVAVFTVNLRESESVVKQVWQVKQLTLPVLMDKDGAAASAYRVGPVPQTVVIHKGTVMHTHVGMPDDFKTVLQSQVASLVKGDSVTRK
jgi:peroxiredoxin